MPRLDRRSFFKATAGAVTAYAGSAVLRPSNAAANLIETGEALLGALASATGGDTIWLKPGSVFPNLRLDDVVFNKMVVIDTPDRALANRPRINKLLLQRCKNLTLANIQFDEVIEATTTGWEQCVTVRQCESVTFSGNEYSGKAATYDKVDVQFFSGSGVGRALEIYNSNNIVVSDSNFTWWSECLNVSDCQGVTIDNNRMQFISNNGVLVIGGSGYKITRNKIGDFRVSPLSGLHPDAIQFGTPGVRQQVFDVLIDGNDIYTGEEGYPDMQSIFGRNEAFDSQGAGRGMFYKDVTITNNKIRSKHINAIDWGATENIRVDNNDVQPWGPKPWPRDVVKRPAIQVAKESVEVSIQHNVGKLLVQMPRWKVKGNKNPYM